jgi:hypothetical protein
MRNWMIRGLGKRTGEGKRLAYEDWGGFVDRGMRTEEEYENMS